MRDILKLFGIAVIVIGLAAGLLLIKATERGANMVWAWLVGEPL